MRQLKKPTKTHPVHKTHSLPKKETKRDISVKHNPPTITQTSLTKLNSYRSGKVVKAGFKTDDCEKQWDPHRVNMAGG